MKKFKKTFEDNKGKKSTRKGRNKGDLGNCEGFLPSCQHGMGQKQVSKTTPTHPTFLKKTFNTLSYDFLLINVVTNRLTKNPKSSLAAQHSH
ncbi:hypothetical protein [Vibrio splendidus]|uniref:hypothetical protein n=1 Tax=Vibrio splendidus TaxID=29497 RepID=UPI0024682C7C|nr:hypothetical protein [Vibrio splendidus]MDH6024653.1 hypothetical protein [Vibrio splendidus]